MGVVTSGIFSPNVDPVSYIVLALFPKHIHQVLTLLMNGIIL